MNNTNNLQALDEVTKAYQRIRSCTHADDKSADDLLKILREKTETILKNIDVGEDSSNE